MKIINTFEIDKAVCEMAKILKIPQSVAGVYDLNSAVNIELLKIKRFKEIWDRLGEKFAEEEENIVLEDL